MGRTSAPRRRVAVLSTATGRWSRRGREVLLGKQDLPKSVTAPLTVRETPITSRRRTEQLRSSMTLAKIPAVFSSKRFRQGEILMSNPFAAPEEFPGFDPTGPGEFRRISARPIERLTDAKAMLGDQYWLFVGICLVGVLIGSIVPMGIMMGPMMCGMYLCFRYRMNGIQVRFETLFKGFDVFVNSLLAMLILLAFSMAVIFPLIIVMLIGIATAGNNEAQVLGVLFTTYPLILVLSLLIYIPFLFVFPLIVDRGTGPWESVKLSARASWHNMGPLCGMLFVHYLVSMLGVCACYVGAFLVMPLTFGALFTVYHESSAAP